MRNDVLTRLLRPLAATFAPKTLLAARAWNRATRGVRPRLSVFWHRAYRLPIPSAERGIGMDPRRADHVLFFLLDAGVIEPTQVVTPERASFLELARVHEEGLLDALFDPVRLAGVFGATPGEVVSGEILSTVRRAAGGTIAALRVAHATKRPVLNLLGGFHHAGRATMGGFCAINDVAMAVVTLRHEGFRGRIAVIDLDAHPPDGTADCLAWDPDVWIGSISGGSYGELPRVDEVVRPDASDEGYLAALRDLLRRWNDPELAIVLAGGDVLAGDRLGKLALSLEGTRRRDALVRDKLRGRGSVWLPAGGYGHDAWKVLAQTALVLAESPIVRVPVGYDPLARRFAAVAKKLPGEDLSDLGDPTFEDIAEELRIGKPGRPRLLGFYSEEGVELALERYGILGAYARLGYHAFRVTVDGTLAGDLVRLRGRGGGVEHVLVEATLSKRRLADRDVLFVEWLTLRHPRAHFDEARPRLPGQEAPGPGLAREAGELLLRMAKRLGLAGVAFTPAHFHIAYAGRKSARFVSPEAEGEFEALVTALRHLPLLEATRLVAEGGVLRNGEPYRWTPSEMVSWVGDPPDVDHEARVEAARAAVRFEPAPVVAKEEPAP